MKAWIDDRYAIGPGHDVARAKLFKLLSGSPQDLTHAERILAPKPALPRLREIRVPTLILVGDADIADVDAHAGAIEAGIAQARRIVVSGTGHLMYLEEPDEFAQTVIRFIEANPE